MLKLARAVARNTRGAIDLASIMVGVLVLGALAGVIAVAVFAVIPWSQNEAAKSTLDSVKDAQSVTKASDGGYQDTIGLNGGSVISLTKSEAAATDLTGSCYVAVAKSKSGDRFYTTDRMATVERVEDDTVADCLRFTQTDSTQAANIALDVDGQLWNLTAIPTKVLAGTQFRSVASQSQIGSYFGVTAAGQLLAWGDWTFGQPAGSDKKKPVDIAPGIKFSSVEAHNDYAMALTETGELYTWGRNYDGQLGNGTFHGTQYGGVFNSTTPGWFPSRILPGVRFASIEPAVHAAMSPMYVGSAAIDIDGNLWTWGGSTGDGTANKRATPAIITPGTKYSKITSGYAMTLALGVDGQVWGWGPEPRTIANHYPSVLLSPTLVAPGYAVKDIAVSVRAILILDTDGHIHTVGNNSFNILGRPATNVFGPAAPGKTFSSIDAGYYVANAIDTSGHLHVWGSGKDRLGLKGAASALIPTRVTAWPLPAVE